MKKIFIIITLFVIFLVSCGYEKIVVTNPINVQRPTVTLDHFLMDKINTEFNIEKNSKDYSMIHMFQIYGDSVVLVMGIKKKLYYANGYTLYSFDDISFVTPTYESDYYLLVYNNGKFIHLNEAYNQKLLLRDDLLDLKLNLDAHYYNHDAWYERIVFKCSIKKNNKYVKCEYVIDKGIRIENDQKDNLINYEFSKEDYDNTIELFMNTYNCEYQMTISQYYGNIDGVKLLRMTPLYYSGINKYYYVGTYKFPTEHEYDRLYVIIDDKIYSLEEAFQNSLIGEYILRFAAFHTSLQKINGRIFGNSGEYTDYGTLDLR